jgi:hypothetical protein
MAFNSENDPDLVIDPDFWGKGFRSRRNDPSIHMSQPKLFILLNILIQVSH